MGKDLPGKNALVVTDDPGFAEKFAGEGNWFSGDEAVLRWCVENDEWWTPGVGGNGLFDWIVVGKSASPILAELAFNTSVNTALARRGVMLVHRKNRAALESFAASAARIAAFVRLVEQAETVREEKKRAAEELEAVEEELKPMRRLLGRGQKARQRREEALEALRRPGLPESERRKLLQRAENARKIEEEAAGVDMERYQALRRRAEALETLSKKPVMSRSAAERESGVDNGEPAWRFRLLGTWGKYYAFRKEGGGPIVFGDLLDRKEEFARWRRLETEELEYLPRVPGNGTGRGNAPQGSRWLEALAKMPECFDPPEVYRFSGEEEAERAMPILPPSSANIVHLLFAGNLDGEMDLDGRKVLVKGTIVKHGIDGVNTVERFVPTLGVFDLQDYSLEFDHY